MEELEVEEQIVHIIDDNKEELKALEWFLLQEGMTVKAYGSAPAFLREFNPQSLGVILLDIQMPGMDGMELLEIINNQDCHMPVIMLSGYGTLKTGVQSMKFGAFDFLEKPFHGSKLLEVVQGALVTSSKIHTSAHNAEILKRRLAALTNREHSIYDYMIEGETNKSISRNLGINRRTVEYHRSNMLKKLEVNCLADLMKISKTP